MYQQFNPFETFRNGDNKYKEQFEQEFNNHFNQKYTFLHDPSKMAILADKQPHVCQLRIRYLMTYLLLRENEKNAQSGLNIAP